MPIRRQAQFRVLDTSVSEGFLPVGVDAETYAHSRQVKHGPAEIRLIAAVMAQAWADLRVSTIRPEVLEWVAADLPGYLYSFRSVCDILGLDCETTRRRFLAPDAGSISWRREPAMNSRDPVADFRCPTGRRIRT